ncbi:MAG: hypothetical protein HRT90_09015 [Candidatus Margulisbacteria bacterium]|nr:hypothetical protein [Candidatus Margulisiibacteriota bacterium]
MPVVKLPNGDRKIAMRIHTMLRSNMTWNQIVKAFRDLGYDICNRKTLMNWIKRNGFRVVRGIEKER